VLASRRAWAAVPTILVILAACCWLVVARQTAGMQPGPGTMGLRAGGFLAVWAAMMAAMMLPAVAPVARLYAQGVAADGGDRVGLRVAGMVAGYLLSWVAVGCAALGLSQAADRLASSHPDAAVYAGSVVLAVAGVYQLTSAKHACLSHCRSPFSLLFSLRRQRGQLRDLRAGIVHGAYCVGCCWALMAALIALGIMDLRWMALLALVITLERTLPRPAPVVWATSAGLLALAAAVPWYPDLVPGLHGHPMMPM
jgi:predicted metal-binding membrane protein